MKSDELQTIVTSALEQIPRDSSGNLDCRVSSVAEAKLLLKRVRQSQKQFKYAKKLMRQEEKNIRSSYSTRQAMVGHNVGSAVHTLIFGKKASGQMNALNRQSIKLQKDRSIRPFEEYVKLIDTTLLDLDRLALKIEEWLIGQEK